MAEKTDPFGAINRPATAAVALVLLLVGPGGFAAARYTAPDPCAEHTAQIAALNARVDALAARVDAITLADVQLRSDVSRLADTLGDVRKIEEQAHPRFRSPPPDP